MNKNNIIAAVSALLMYSPMAASAQTEASMDEFSLDALSCWEVISLPEEDANFVTAMLIGFTQGQAGQSKTSPKAIVDLVETFDETCGENPDMAAIDAIAK